MSRSLRALAVLTLCAAAPLATAQLPVEVVRADRAGAATAAASGVMVFDPPQAAVSDTTLVFTFGPEGTTAEASLTLSNVAPAGSEALAFTAFVRRPLDAAGGENGDQSVFLTQSASQDVIGGFMSICSPTSTTSYWRVFDLAEEEFSGELAISSVEIGIAQTPAVETTLRLYRLDGSLQFGTTTLLYETTVSLDGSEGGGALSVPVDAVIDADAQLAVEWNTPTIPDAGPFVGINPSGESRPHYRSYPGCFSTDLPPIAQPSGHQHWVLNVRGAVGAAPVSVAPGAGLISAEDDQELVVTVDSMGMPEGVHPYELVILTNDPERPEVVVDLVIAIEPLSVSGEEVADAGLVSLSQNFPNPFAGSTRIEFTLREAGPVTLDVLDVTGRRVASLVSSHHVAGAHAVSWDASGVAAGVYVVRMQAVGEVRTVRALVTR